MVLILQELFEELDYPVWIKDKENQIVFINNTYKSFINSSNEEIGENELSNFIDSIYNVKDKSKNIIKLGNKLFKHIIIPNHRLNCIIGILVDISEISELVNLEYDKDILNTVIDNIPELIFYKDKDLKYVEINKECKKFYENMGLIDVIGKTDLELPLDKSFIYQCYEHDKIVLETKEPLYIEEMTEGKVFETIKTPILSKNGKVEGLVGVVRDITNSKKKENSLRKLSYTDGLTKIYNRIYFDEKVNELIKNECYPIGVILGDVNGLKIVNDSLGHLEGYKLLIKMSEILSQSSKDIGTVFRWGGDEFVILLPECSSNECTEVMNSIDNLCKSTKWGNINLSISQGYSILTEDNNIDKVLVEAEDKVYRQKMLSSKAVRGSMLETLKIDLQSRNVETEMHTYRVAKYCRQIAEALQLDEEMIENASIIGSLHDIGKIDISEHILLKPVKLTDEEYNIMKTHSEKGYRLACLLPEISPISREILTHHERWDGKGYPLGLQKDEIPILARIVSVVDSYDAMTDERCYSKKMSKDEAISEIRRCAGAQFDPHIVDVFIDIINK